MLACAEPACWIMMSGVLAWVDLNVSMVDVRSFSSSGRGRFSLLARGSMMKAVAFIFENSVVSFGSSLHEPENPKLVMGRSRFRRSCAVHAVPGRVAQAPWTMLVPQMTTGGTVLGAMGVIFLPGSVAIFRVAVVE